MTFLTSSQLVVSLPYAVQLSMGSKDEEAMRSQFQS